MKRIYLSLSLLLLVIIGSRAANFKFAFLTDIHITAGDSIPYNDLARSVNQINDTPGIEFAIVSGDITNIGDRQSMEVVKSLLDRLNVEYHIIPGNHETKWSESGVTDFARVFGNERFKFEHDGILFMGVNSGPIIRMADGHVAPQDIDWIKTELDKAGKEKPVIFITHYPLQPGDRCHTPLQYPPRHGRALPQIYATGIRWYPRYSVPVEPTSQRENRRILPV